MKKMIFIITGMLLCSWTLAEESAGLEKYLDQTVTYEIPKDAAQSLQAELQKQIDAMLQTDGYLAPLLTHLRDRLRSGVAVLFRPLVPVVAVLGAQHRPRREREEAGAGVGQEGAVGDLPPRAAGRPVHEP